MSLKTGRVLVRGSEMNRQSGFSLIEVMVSFLILGVGLLGMGTMVSNGIQMNQTAQFRTTSVVLAQDMIDRIRANNSIDYTTIDIDAAAINDSCTLGSNATLAACNSLADTDVAKWKESITDLLPGGVGFICKDDTPMDGDSPSSPACDGGDAVAVKIWWVDNSQEDGEDANIIRQRYVSVMH